MCNLDKIYALIVLECVARQERPLESAENDFQDKMADRLKGGFRKHRPILGAVHQAVFSGGASSGSDSTPAGRKLYISPALEVQ